MRPPALDKYTMRSVFEGLIRRSNEENNEKVGRRFTPCGFVELVASLISSPSPTTSFPALTRVRRYLRHGRDADGRRGDIHPAGQGSITT